MKRIFDIFFSGLGLILLSPLFLLLGIWIKLDSVGSVFYKQLRVGRDGSDFYLYKFRSMRMGSDKKGLITVGERDPRITNSGYFIRKYKLDEFPQLLNVIKGEMSLVGPRPEVRKYVELYNKNQLKVLEVRPGITDLASIKYRNENELLAQAEDPDSFYIQEVMPAKLQLNLEYIDKRSFLYDMGLIFKTLKAIVNE